MSLNLALSCTVCMFYIYIYIFIFEVHCYINIGIGNVTLVLILVLIFALLYIFRCRDLIPGLLGHGSRNWFNLTDALDRAATVTPKHLMHVMNSNPLTCLILNRLLKFDCRTSKNIKYSLQ